MLASGFGMAADERTFRLSPGARGDSSQLLRQVLAARGWTETPGDAWRLYWDIDIPPADVVQRAGPPRVLNRFPGIAALGSKHWLHRTLTAARRRLAPDGLDGLVDITPLTFGLPEEYLEWTRAARWHPDRMWIQKPKEGSRGHGVALVSSNDDVAADANVIVQQYVDRPRLIAGRKFTLRCYVLLTSLDPLVAYLHEDGFVKLASRPFSIAPEHRPDRFRHLTNPDVLRYDAEMPTSEHNRSHRTYREQLRAEGVDDTAVWESIRRTLTAAVMAARGVMLRVNARDAVAPACFELLGCDVTLDERLRPLLLECNYAPSLSVEAAADRPASREEHDIKRRVLDDTFAIVEAGLLGSQAQTSVVPAAERLQRELACCGGFSLLVPSATAVPLMPVVERLERSDLEVLAATVDLADRTVRPSITPGVSSGVLDGQCVLAHPGRLDLYVLNPVASAIWLGIEDAVPLDTVATEIARATGTDRRRVDVDLWASLAEWTSAGLVGGTAPSEARVRTGGVSAPRIGWNPERVYRVRDTTIAVRAPGDVLERWIQPTLRALESPDATVIDGAIEAIASENGFELHSSWGAARKVPHAGMLAGELHLMLERMALARSGVSFVFSAALDEDDSGPIVVLGRRTSSQWRLLVQRDAHAAVRLMLEDGRVVVPRAYQWHGQEEGSYRAVTPAEGLARLIADSEAAPLVIDARAAEDLADLAMRSAWRVPAV